MKVFAHCTQLLLTLLRTTWWWPPQRPKHVVASYLHHIANKFKVVVFWLLDITVYILGLPYLKWHRNREGKQWQTTPKNLPRMQRTRVIPVAWLSSGLCPNWPKGWIPIIIIRNRGMWGNIVPFSFLWIFSSVYVTT